MNKETEPQKKCISEQAALVQKWAPVIEKCGNLETEEQRYLLANTLEALRAKAMAKDTVTLEAGGTLNIVNTNGSKRLVVEYDDNGELGVRRQRLDWVAD